MNLSRKLLGSIFITTFLVVSAISLLSYNFTKSALKETISQNRLEIAQQTMDQIDRLLYERYIDIQEISGEDFLQSLLGKKAEENKFSTNRMKELMTVTGPWDILFVVTPEGRIVLSTHEEETDKNKNINMEPNSLTAFQEAMKGVVYHSDLILSDDTQRPTIIYAAPIRDKEDPKQSIIGIMIGHLAWPAIEEIIEAIPSEIAEHAMLVNQEGVVIGCSRPDMEMIGLDLKENAAVQTALMGKAKSIVTSQEESMLGVASLTSYVPQQGHLSYQPNGWGLIMEIPLNLALESASQAALKLVLLLIPILLLMSGIIVLLVSRLIIRPVSLLTATTQAIKAGDLSQQAPVLSQDEIGMLATSFNQMIQDLSKTTVSKEYLETTLASIGDAVIVTDIHANVTFMNVIAQKLTGWDFSEAKGKSIENVFDIVNSITRQRAESPVYKVIQEGAIRGLANHTILITKSKKEFPIDDSAAPIRDRNHQIIGVILVFRDVSDRYYKDLQLRESEQKFRAITETTSDAIISIDSDGNIIFWNNGAEQTFGYSKEVMLGKSLTQIMPERFRTAHQAGIKRYLATGKANVLGKLIELAGLKKSGKEFPLELTLSTWEQNSKIFFTGVIRDISYRKEIEKEKTELEIQLRGAQKLEAIGQLAAGIAHEINTPTQYIGDNTKFIQDAVAKIIDVSNKAKSLTQAAAENKLTPQLIQEVQAAYQNADIEYLCAEIPSAITQSLEGISRISEIVRAMKEFSHPGGQEKTPVDLNHALQMTITVARNEWKYIAEMETDFDPNLPFTPCMPGEINQVFLNLIVNAAHAIAEKFPHGEQRGKILIRTRRNEKWIKIEFTDTGNGIPESIRDKIFDPFFTTKDVGKGSGQGLAIARSVIVDKHQGTLTFETTIGIGTTFVIHLPLQQDE